MIITTPTLEGYIQVIEFAFSLNMTWRSGRNSIHENYWEAYKDRTCIFIRDGDNTMAYDDKNAIMDVEGYGDIISVEQFCMTVTNKFKKKYGLK